MIVWRLSRSCYADLSGSGGMYGAARWHHKGHPILYTSESIALAVVEVRVHTKRAPIDYALMKIEIPDGSIQVVASLPDGWQGCGSVPRGWGPGSRFRSECLPPWCRLLTTIS